jgi:GT2 family glycosyltransferase
VLIGDDGSHDDPGQLATRDSWVRVLTGPALNSYAARNRASRAATASILAFCDADCEPEPSWLERGLAALADADLVAGRIRFKLPRRATSWTYVDMETSKNHRLLTRLGTAETANLFVRRDVFEALDGFDDSIDEHGDFDFVERAVAAGYRLSYSPEAVVWHPTRDRARSVLRAHWIYSRGYAARAVSRGEKPDGLKLRNWMPILPVMRSRRRFGVSLTGPDATWLAENGVRLSSMQKLKTLPIIYVLLPYTRALAQARGAMDGRRRRSNGRPRGRYGS